MQVVIVIGAFVLLTVAAYRGYSVILFAPLAALLAVAMADPASVAPAFSGLFMQRMADFLKLYFPVFALGAIFGKLIEVSGFSKSIAAGVIRLVGERRAILSVVIVCALLTYGGVSLFVVVFAVFPLAADLFQRGQIPKRLIPATIALGAFTFTMDALPGSPQIQNIIPTSFFGTTAWAAPSLGVVGAVFILVAGLLYLQWRCKSAQRAGEGYTSETVEELESRHATGMVHPMIALLPLLVVGVVNFALVLLLERLYQSKVQIALPGLAEPIVLQLASVKAIWAVMGALLAGIVTTIVLAFRRVSRQFAECTRIAIGGAMLAATSVASEFGFGAVIASLAGFATIKQVLVAIPNPLVNEAATITALAAITGSASGGLSIALAAMSGQFLSAAQQFGISPQVLHRVASMASGGMDTLPHNGSVITLLAVAGLTHRQSYIDIFAITCVKTTAVFFVIAVYYLTGLV